MLARYHVGLPPEREGLAQDSYWRRSFSRQRIVQIVLSNFFLHKRWALSRHDRPFGAESILIPDFNHSIPVAITGQSHFRFSD